MLIQVHKTFAFATSFLDLIWFDVLIFILFHRCVLTKNDVAVFLKYFHKKAKISLKIRENVGDIFCQNITVEKDIEENYDKLNGAERSVKTKYVDL